MSTTKMKKRRKRSHMTEDQAVEAFKRFCRQVKRMGESSDAAMFRNSNADAGTAYGELNVQFLVKGQFGVAEDVFEAVRIFGGHKLPAKKP